MGASPCDLLSKSTLQAILCHRIGTVTASMGLEEKAIEIFEKCDKDGDGTLSIKELRPVLKKSGVKLGKKGAARLKKLDEDGDKQLDQAEFIKMFKMLKRKKEPEEEGDDDDEEDEEDEDF